MNGINNYEFSDSIGRLTMVISRNIGELLEIKFEEKGYNITAKHWILISYLHNFKVLSQKQLVQLSGENKVMINRLIDRMEEDKWMTRSISDKDKRFNNIELTKKGLLVYKKLSKIVAEAINIAYGNLSKENIELVINLLHQISTNLISKLDNIK